MARTTDLASGLAAVQTIAGNARLKIKSFGWRRAEIECNSKTHLEQICGRAISTRNAFSAIAKQIWDLQSLQTGTVLQGKDHDSRPLAQFIAQWKVAVRAGSPFSWQPD